LSERGRLGRHAGPPAGSDVERLIQLLARLPGLGPRSARRAALHLLRRKEGLMDPLAQALQTASNNVQACSRCRNLDTIDPCAICRDETRDPGLLCVVEQVGDLWALERSMAFKGRYFVLGGTLSALDGIGPDDLGVEGLLARVAEEKPREIVLALNATVDGQTTAHYLADRLTESGASVTRLAHGVPVGGELDYLDDGTLIAAFAARRRLGANSL
jgi:recombination protein RecR